jgi:hypothetical protein
MLLLWRRWVLPLLSLPLSVRVSCAVRSFLVYGDGNWERMLVTEDVTSGMASCRNCQGGCACWRFRAVVQASSSIPQLARR